MAGIGSVLKATFFFKYKEAGAFISFTKILLQDILAIILLFAIAVNLLSPISTFSSATDSVRQDRAQCTGLGTLCGFVSPLGVSRQSSLRRGGLHTGTGHCIPRKFMGLVGEEEGMPFDLITSSGPHAAQFQEPFRTWKCLNGGPGVHLHSPRGEPSAPASPALPAGQ